MSQLKITWKTSTIGKDQRQRKVIEALGLHRLNHTVLHRDSPTIKGMVRKVIHLLEVEEIKEVASSSRRRKQQ